MAQTWNHHRIRSSTGWNYVRFMIVAAFWWGVPARFHLSYRSHFELGDLYIAIAIVQWDWLTSEGPGEELVLDFALVGKGVRRRGTVHFSSVPYTGSAHLMHGLESHFDFDVISGRYPVFHQSEIHSYFPLNFDQFLFQFILNFENLGSYFAQLDSLESEV